MPRVSRERAAQNHQAIERAGARLIREQGLAASVADIMSAAGLTHGGFYGHFRAKDELLAAACAAAFADSVARWRARSAGAANPAAALEAVIGGYLDPALRGAGCPLAELAIDVARAGPERPVRRAFREGLEQLLAILTELQPGGAGRGARERALLQLAALVGARVLARATQGHGLAEELLAAGRRQLPARRTRRSRGRSARSGA